MADQAKKCMQEMQTFTEVAETIRDSKGGYFLHLEQQQHYNQLFYFVQQALDSVTGMQTTNGRDFLDPVDEEVLHQIQWENTVVCQECHTVNPKRKKKCIGCGKPDGIKMAKMEKCDKAPVEDVPRKQSFQFRVDPDAHDVTISCQAHEKFSHVPSGHKDRKTIVLTEPFFCNPNSYDRVESVLRQIGIENGISRYGGGRICVRMGCHTLSASNLTRKKLFVICAKGNFCP